MNSVFLYNGVSAKMRPRAGHVLVCMNPDPSNLKHVGVAESLHFTPPRKSSGKSLHHPQMTRGQFISLLRTLPSLAHLPLVAAGLDVTRRNPFIRLHVPL